MNLVEMVVSIGIEWRDYSFHFVVVIVVDKIVDSIVVELVVDILENKRLVVDSVLDSTRMVVWCYLKRNKDSRVGVS
jgi:hypothetical protein